jgi:hypothetical protein
MWRVGDRCEVQGPLPLCERASRLRGKAKPYRVALVSLDNEAIIDWAGKHGLADKSFAEIARDERTQELIAGQRPVEWCSSDR